MIKVNSSIYKGKWKSINVICIGKNYYKKRLNKIGVNVIELKKKKTIFGIIEIYFLLKKISFKNDIIFISNINYTNVLSIIFLRNIKNLKIIITERTPLQELELYFNFIELIKKKIILYLAKLIYKKADYIIGNSKKVTLDIKFKLGVKAKTIYPIIKLDKFDKKNLIKF